MGWNVVVLRIGTKDVTGDTEQLFVVVIAVVRMAVVVTGWQLAGITDVVVDGVQLAWLNTVVVAVVQSLMTVDVTGRHPVLELDGLGGKMTAPPGVDDGLGGGDSGGVDCGKLDRGVLDRGGLGCGGLDCGTGGVCGGGICDVVEIVGL